jgi:hypothetical protein
MQLNLVWRTGRVLGFTLLMSAVLPSAYAQTDGGDPPSRVARLDYLDGPVTYEPAGASEWAYAVPNRPLTTGDQVWVDTQGRSELHVGSTALWLGASTNLQFVNLDDSLAQMKVSQGTVEMRVRAVAPGAVYEIDTPNLALQITTPGLYRLDVAADGSGTTVTVRVGAAVAYGNAGSTALQASQSVTFGGVDLQQTQAGDAPPLDAFDQWVAVRSRAEDHAVSARYVSREMPGYEDLDANGTWSTDPTYGPIWVPLAARSSAWAPYRQGHWTWVAPWGWTWIDDAAWGFAPFHYGRWVYVGHSWAWVPGARAATVQPAYAPALVAFVGTGNNWNVNLAAGAAAGIAWFPLAPGEAWRPAYRASPAYFNRVNITNVRVTNINVVNNVYINQRTPGAVTAVPADAFVQGRPVATAALRLRPEQVAHLSVMGGAPAIAPVRESYMPNARIARERPPQAMEARQVVATRAPVTPPALRDSLAVTYARGTTGRVPGAGEPVVREVPPAGGQEQTAAQRYRLVQAAQRPLAAPPRPAPQAPVRPGAGPAAVTAPGAGNPNRGAPQPHAVAPITQPITQPRPLAAPEAAPGAHAAAPQPQHTEPPYRAPAPVTAPLTPQRLPEPHEQAPRYEARPVQPSVPQPRAAEAAPAQTQPHAAPNPGQGRPEMRPEVRPEVHPDMRPAPRPETPRPQANAAPHPPAQPEAHPQGRPEAPHPEARPHDERPQGGKPRDEHNGA